MQGIAGKTLKGLRQSQIRAIFHGGGETIFESAGSGQSEFCMRVEG